MNNVQYLDKRNRQEREIRLEVSMLWDRQARTDPELHDPRAIHHFASQSSKRNMVIVHYHTVDASVGLDRIDARGNRAKPSEGNAY